MRLQEQIDFTTLNWVKQELDETLRQARQALEAYAEDTADSSLMRFCATYLHQVQGTLRMVELYGAAMVVEEMERVAQAILDNQIRNLDDAFEALLRGTLQLPDYLERLQSGHKDIPIVLLPLLNDLRACRGEKLLSEGVLFMPDISLPMPVTVKGPARVVADTELRQVAARLRLNYQAALVKFLRDQSSSLAMTGMLNALDGLASISSQEDLRRLWWVASGLLDCLRTGAVEAAAAVKLLFGRVDREIKRVVDTGESGFAAQPPRELLKNLLYYVAQAKSVEGRAAEIKRLYRLDELVASEQEVEQARDSLIGRNRAVLETVSVAIKDDLLRVKDALDLFLRTANANARDLAPQIEILDRVADTLGVLGLGVPRRVILEQREALNKMVIGERAVDEGALLDVAGALLFVEASLDDNIEHQGTGGAEAEQSLVAVDSGLELPQAEVRKILESLMKEVQTNLQQIKQDVVAFIESGWDHAKAEHIPRLLDEISGAMRMVNLGEAASLTGAMSKFMEVELLRRKRVPTADQMDRLADAVASMEFYLEATQAQRVGRERILDVTRESLSSLGYWPVPVDHTPLAEVPTDQPVIATAAPKAVVPEREAFVPPTPVDVDVSSLRFGVDSSESAAASRRFHEHEIADASLPSVEVPGAQELQAFADRVGQVDAGMDFTESTRPPAAAIEPELRSVVSIAAGAGIEGTLIGEQGQAAAAELAHDLQGMKFAETSSAHALEDEEEFDIEWVEVEREVVDDAAPASVGSFQSLPSDDIDEEIREVFLEEVQEEVENLGRGVPTWKKTPGDFELLKPIRRSFHTMKGSGRLVGAMALGEFSWKIEGMLNRVLDKTIQPNEAVLELLDHALAALPQLLAALRGEPAGTADIAGIMEVADSIAAGEDAHLKPATPLRRMEKVLVQVKKPRPRAPAAVPVVEPVELSESFDIHRSMEPAEPSVSAALWQPPETSATVASPVSSISLAPAASVDPLMLEILRSEVAGHLGTVANYLDQCASAPHPLVITEEMLRAVHTMHGAIAMVELPGLLPVLGPLEGYVKRLRGAGVAPSQTGMLAIVDAATAIEAGVAAADTSVVVADNGSLVDRLNDLRNELPEPHSFEQVFNIDVRDEETSAEPEPETETEAEPEADAEAQGAVVPPLAESLEDRESTVAVALSGQSPAPEISEFMEVSDADLDFTESAENTLETAPVAAGIVADSTAPMVNEEELFALDFSTDAEFAPELDALEDWSVESALFSEVADDAESIGTPGAVASAPDLEDTATSDELTPPEGFVAAVDPLASAALEDMDFGVAGVSESATEESALDQPAMAATAAAEGFAAAETTAAAGAAAPGQVEAQHQPIAEDISPDAALVLPDLDEDLLDIFVQEGKDILDSADSLMARLREHPQDHDLVIGLQRELHTLKGGARMAGLAPVGDLGHAMESLLEMIAEGRHRLDRVALESLDAGFDRLLGLVSRVDKRLAIGMPVNAIARFEALAAGEAIPVLGGVADEAQSMLVETPVADVTVAVEAELERPIRPPAATSRPTARDLAAEEAEEIARPQQEMIRVRSDLLDNLVNFAGEVSIYRSRLEQQMSTYRFNLQELDQTVVRLREQLRKLEIETEAQIIARYQREAEEASGEFDPLELDRFSTLQQLTRALAESASDLVSLQGVMDDVTRQSETLLLQQSRVSSELQEGLMRTRMVPFDSMVPRLRRLMRQTAGELGKRAQLRVEGAQGEMDRNVLERMTAPLEHMLRNALAHGLETPAERVAAGKPEEGTVTIRIAKEATEVVIRISDDGKGMDRVAIRRKAIERGLLKDDAKLSDRDLFGFVMEPGFSTAQTVSKIAGRGVGMDVVNSEIKQLGGSLMIDSKSQRGTEFTVRLPFTLAVTQAIMVRLGEHLFAVPMSSVQGVARIRRHELDERLKSAAPIFTYGGDDYSIYELSELLGTPAHRASDDAQLPMLMTRSGDQRAAIRVDSVLGSREIVVKSVGPQVSSVPGIFGATIMGNGAVVMILDMAPLVRRSVALKTASLDEFGEAAEAVPAVAAEVRRQPLIMVVDDSITMRKVTSRVLERSDMEVATAKDGLDAVEKLQDRVPDLVLLDIEMPRMDGYELATYMRNDPRLKAVPIIMITSRTGEKHRQRAFDIGVDRYLGKPYQEADLLQNVEEILRLNRALH